jgi:hypothetical protein
VRTPHPLHAACGQSVSFLLSSAQLSVVNGVPMGGGERGQCLSRSGLRWRAMEWGDRLHAAHFPLSPPFFQHYKWNGSFLVAVKHPSAPEKRIVQTRVPSNEKAASVSFLELGNCELLSGCRSSLSPRQSSERRSVRDDRAEARLPTHQRVCSRAPTHPFPFVFCCCCCSPVCVLLFIDRCGGRGATAYMRRTSPFLPPFSSTTSGTALFLKKI